MAAFALKIYSRDMVCGSLLFALMFFFGAAHSTHAKEPINVAEVVRFKSTRGQKVILACEPRSLDDHSYVYIRLLSHGKQVLLLKTYQYPYRSQSNAKKQVRVNWRDDGKAVAIDVKADSGGSQETSPFYVVWDRELPKRMDYQRRWPTNRKYVAGETETHFERWDTSGEPIFVVDF